MTTFEERRERVRQGSRRQRDLQAVVADDRRQTAALFARVRRSSEVAAAWDAAQALLRRSVPELTWLQWMDPLRLAGECDGVICLTAPKGIRAWVERRYGKLIGDAIRAVSDYRGAFFDDAAESQVGAGVAGEPGP